jgi:hypothetical protein
MGNEKKEQVNESKDGIKQSGAEQSSDKPTWREIIIQTNGNDIKLTKAEVAGNLELLAILQSLIGHLSEKK